MIMPSFQEIRDLLLIAYSEKLLSDEEFVLLYEDFRPQNPEFPYFQYDTFNLHNMNDDECLAEFRFKKTDIQTLKEALHLPDVIRCQQRTVCDSTEALCMLLKRLAYPCRYGDMIHRFARPVPEMCMITNEVTDYLHDNHAHRILQWNEDVLNPGKLQEYANAIYNKGAPLDNCFGFVDGTVRAISRPGHNQRTVYNGHKRIHALKFQSVVVPSGIIANMFGPVGEFLNFKF